MHYIIFDLEWNQPPTLEAAITSPIYVSGEIIQIGAVKLNDAFEVIDELRLFIRPTYYPKLHKKISSLTHIRDRDLLDAPYFPQAYEQFTQWCGKEYAYMTWSMSDMPMLLENMLLHGIDCSRLPVCYDIQRIFCREINRSSARCSLDHALEILNLKGDVAHDALHDARNTAKVCSYLDLDQYSEEYAAPAYALPLVSEAYATIHDALKDPSLKVFSCPFCDAEITTDAWLTLSPQSFISYGYCPEEDDEFILQLTVHNLRPGEFYIHRMFYGMSDDLWEIYQDHPEPRP